MFFSESQSTREDQDNAPWSNADKAKLALAGVVVVGGVYFLARAYMGALPTPTELRFLLSSANKFGLKHVSILRRLAEATGYNVNAMMTAIEAPAMEVAAAELATKFPAAILPAGTNYSVVAQYLNAAGNTVTHTIKLFGDTGASIYQASRAETIRQFVVKNMLPALQKMFTDFIVYAKSGMTDMQILNAMTAPALAVELPHAATAATTAGATALRFVGP